MDDNVPLYISIEMEGRKMKMKNDQISILLLGKVFLLMPDSIVSFSEDGEVESPLEDTFLSLLKKYTCIGEPIPTAAESQVCTPFSYQTLGPSKFAGNGKGWAT